MKWNKNTFVTAGGLLMSALLCSAYGLLVAKRDIWLDYSLGNKKIKTARILAKLGANVKLTTDDGTPLIADSWPVWDVVSL